MNIVAQRIIDILSYRINRIKNILQQLIEKRSITIKEQWIFHHTRKIDILSLKENRIHTSP